VSKPKHARWRVHPSLAHLTVGRGTLTPWPGNPRRGDVELIRQSLTAFGQLKPIVVQSSTGWICAGNHLWEATGSGGWPAAWGLGPEEPWPDVAAVVADLTDEEARRFLLLDNRASDSGSYDDTALAELLEQLSRTEDGLWSTGYSDQQLSDLLAELAEDFDPDDSGPPAGPGGAAVVTSWELMIACGSEAMRERLVRRFREEGLNVRTV
jgi:hypothetical protein